MIKRFILLCGFLLLPATTQAATALSPWVQGVVDLAEQGIRTAESLPVSAVCDDTTKLAVLQSNLAFAKENLDTIITMETETWQLRERTVCYESDRQLMLTTMQRILDAMNDLTDQCKFAGVDALKGAYSVVREAYESFLKGGTNPSHTDPILRYTYPFQDSILWYELSEPLSAVNSTAPLCPFTTDYAPHTIGYIPVKDEPDAEKVMYSFGCDLTVLESLGPGLSSEAQTFKDFLTKTDEFSRSVYETVGRALTSLDTLLALYNKKDPADDFAVAKPAPEHKELTSCLRPFIPDEAKSDPQEWEDLLATFPEYFTVSQYPLDADGKPVFQPQATDVLPMGLLFQPIVDFFRLDSMSMILLRNFIDRRGDAGFLRPLPEKLAAGQLDSYLNVLLAVNSQNDLRFISVNNEQAIAYMEAVNRDGYERMVSATAPLHDAVAKLVEVTDDFLPKTYVPSLTYFLARSCVDGHCQSTLDNVSKRIFNPYCTPYVSGLYADEDASRKCFCDDSVKDTWGDYDKYCNEDFSADVGKYEAMPKTLIPACLEDGFESSASSSS